MKVSYHDFIHPEDQAAQEQLRTIPVFAGCVEVFLKIGVERVMHGVNMAQRIHLGPRQLPAIYQHVPQVCERLGLAVPDVYLEMNPTPNAYTLGETRPFIVVTSGLVESMDEDELHAVLAHECGHIACRHTLYRTMAMLLAWIGPQVFGPLAALSAPVQLALQYWMRRGELSADRAAAAVLKSPTPVVEAMIRLAGGPKAVTKDVDVDEYLAQADAYDKLQESNWDKFLQSLAVMQQTHPFAAVRAREILGWAKTESFARLVQALDALDGVRSCAHCSGALKAQWRFCGHCGQPVPSRQASVDRAGLESKESA
jgi:Zn-dependent protease with chaperone function